jgi:thioredoxin
MKALLMAGGAVLMFGCETSSDTGQASIEPRQLTSADYEDFIATQGKLTAVMFHADWCGPCRQLGPVVEEVVGEFEGSVVLGRINVDDAGELARSLGVTGIPDLRLFRDGVMVDAMKGSIPKEQVRDHFAIQVAQLGASPPPQSGGEKSEPVVQPMTKDLLPPGMEKK